MGVRLSVPTRAPFRGPATNSITFASPGTGDDDTVTDVFTITGEVIVIYMVPYCVTSLERTAPTPTLKLGSAVTTTLFVGPTDVTKIQAGKFWVYADTAYAGILLPDKCRDVLLSANITCKVAGSNNISAGVIRFDVYWRALSSDGALAPA